MRNRQLLVPLGLIVIPGIAVGWLLLQDEPDPEPVATSAPEKAAPAVPAPEPVDDDPEPRRRPRPRPRPRADAEEPDDRPAPGEEEGFEGEGGGPTGPKVGEPFPHPGYGVAVDHLQEGDPAAALEEAEACLKEAPKHRGCWDAKLRATLMNGDLEGARELVASCAEGRDDPALCKGAEVLVALEDGDFDGAQATLAALEEESPGSRYTLMARAQLFDKEGNDKMAKMNFTLACVNGHAVACKQVPGVKQAGGE